MRYFSTLD